MGTIRFISFIPAVLLGVLHLISSQAWAQCASTNTSVALSPRNANYVMTCQLDTATKSVHCTQKVIWINPSPDTLEGLSMYMYMNAFKHTRTTFLHEVGGSVFGENFLDRNADEWGYIEIDAIKERGLSRKDALRYIQPDDQRAQDESLIWYEFEKPLHPQDTVVLELEFTSKLPKLLVRSGFSRNQFYHFVHWFPQVTVYEPDDQGRWHWNHHQFHRSTEFFSDFGNYDVTLTVPQGLIVGGSGCMSELPGREGWSSYHFLAEDVIDFAWVAYPDFHKTSLAYNGLDIHFLVAREHDNLLPRFKKALFFSLDYLETHVGPYPYPSLTVMDPPVHALRSGFMEYPMYITLGAFRYFPESVRSIESLVVHEFTHQYFMAVVATNEKEDAWMDEGMVTYYEDRIMEAMFGEKASLIDYSFVQIPNSAFTRDEYVRLPDPSVAEPARSGWEIPESYKGLVYSKVATALRTLEKLIGKDLFDQSIQNYYSNWQFKHPKEGDLIESFKEIVRGGDGPVDDHFIGDFFNQTVFGSEICDYEVSEIYEITNPRWVGWRGEGMDRTYYREDDQGQGGRVILRRKGGVILPVDVKIIFENGQTLDTVWTPLKRLTQWDFPQPVQTCVIDPHRKMLLDVNICNNALSQKEDKKPLITASSQLSAWVQNILQSLSFLI